MVITRLKKTEFFVFQNNFFRFFIKLINLRRKFLFFYIKTLKLKFGYHIWISFIMSDIAISISLFIIIESKLPFILLYNISFEAWDNLIKIFSSLSVPLFLNLSSNCIIDGGDIKIYLHSNVLSFTDLTPWMSISKIQIFPSFWTSHHKEEKKM